MVALAVLFVAGYVAVNYGIATRRAEQQAANDTLRRMREAKR